MKRTNSNAVVANYIEDVIVPSYLGWILLASGEERQVNSREELAGALLSTMSENF